MPFQLHPIPLNSPHTPIPQVPMSDSGADRSSLRLDAMVILEH